MLLAKCLVATSLDSTGLHDGGESQLFRVSSSKSVVLG